MSDGNIGYVVCGYLDSEGPDNITVEGNPFTGQPFESAYDAWLEVESNGGPRADATIIVGRVVPVGVISVADATDEELAAAVLRVEDTFGRLEGHVEDNQGILDAASGTVIANV